MSVIEDLKVLALRDVMADTPDHQIRYIRRWYSKTFHTPLHEVNGISLYDVLIAFWEESFEDADSDQLNEIKTQLLETEAQRRIRLIKEEETKHEEDRFMAEVQAEALKQEKTKKIGPIKSNDQQPIRPIVKQKEMKEASIEQSLKMLKELPPDIKINFMDSSKFEEMIDEADGISIGKK